MSFKIIEWNTNLDLTNFYSAAKEKGFENNSSQKVLIDCFDEEKDKQVWILYYNDIAVGSVAAHSFDIMGENSYRIAARTCVLTHLIPGNWSNSLKTIKKIETYQNPAAQFLIPTCIKWAPKNSNLYITTNELPVASQKRVHNIFAIVLEKQEILERKQTLMYRGVQQTIWKLDSKKYYEMLSKFPKWN